MAMTVSGLMIAHQVAGKAMRDAASDLRMLQQIADANKTSLGPLLFIESQRRDAPRVKAPATRGPARWPWKVQNLSSNLSARTRRVHPVPGRRSRVLIEIGIF